MSLNVGDTGNEQIFADDNGTAYILYYGIYSM